MLTRARHAWNVLRGRSDAHWSAEQINQINYEMAEGIIAEIRETLEKLDCCHGNAAETMPMFYREAILCAMEKAREEGRAEMRRR